MIVLATDFGNTGPYVGQVKAVLARWAPQVPVIDLFADLPVFAPYAAAYLLPAYCRSPFPLGTVFLCVVDPGVGSDRLPLVVLADGFWFVGPDNGVFSQIVRRAQWSQVWSIGWRPELVSSTFHGRDVFAPVAAALAVDPEAAPHQFSLRERNVLSVDRVDWLDDVAEILYFDHYGNAITGVRANALKKTDGLVLGERVLLSATTFSDLPVGEAFWYANSNGLAEIAVNSASAKDVLRLKIGQAFCVLADGDCQAGAVPRVG